MRAISSRVSSSGRPRSIHSMSARRVITESTRRSSRLTVRWRISPSVFSNTPDSVPSRIKMRTSSSVTLPSSTSLMPNRRISPPLLRLRSHTTGDATFVTRIIGLAMRDETASGLPSAICLGHEFAHHEREERDHQHDDGDGEALGPVADEADAGQRLRQLLGDVAPANAPDRTPTSVIPIWTAERNRSGLSIAPRPPSRRASPSRLGREGAASSRRPSPSRSSRRPR